MRLDFKWSDLEVKVVDPKSTRLLRLFQRKYPDGGWTPPPPQFRNLRVDPPAGHKDDYSVLYTSTSLETIAQECRILAIDGADRCTINGAREAAYCVARYDFSNGGIFIPLDGRNADVFDMGGVLASSGNYDDFQSLGFELYNRFSHFAHGICWRSYHRRQNGPVFAIWHSRKDALGLARPKTSDLKGDSEWASLLFSGNFLPL